MTSKSVFHTRYAIWLVETVNQDDLEGANSSYLNVPRVQRASMLAAERPNVPAVPRV
eukprot:COSAG01_NODE_6395_length_3693_cov_2.142181_2_plen_57_part_00